MMDKVKLYSPWVIALLMLSAAVWSWYHPKEVERIRTEYQDRTKTVYVKVPVPVQGGNVQGTGDTVQGNPVVATADCPATPGGSEVVSTVSPSTGEVHILTRPKPLSLFGFEDQKEIGARYGVGKTEIDLFARWTFFRVGSFYAAAYAEGSMIGTTSSSNVMLEVSYRW